MMKVLLIGGGGHARVLLDILRLRGERIEGYLDKEEKQRIDIPYLGDDDRIGDFCPGEYALVNGVGSVNIPLQKTEIFNRFKKMGYTFISVVHPQAVISKSVTLGEGVQVMAGVVVNPGAEVRENVILNTKATVDHDCFIGAHSHLAPGCTLSGHVVVGEGCHLGTGVNVIQNVKIGGGVLIAAGETVRQDVPAGDIVFPAGKRGPAKGNQT